jgi:DNA-binding transcriptional MocR family regulator
MSEISTRHQTGAPQNLEQRFAARAAGMQPSEIRALFAVASRPEIVSLAGGMPNLSALPMKMMASVVNDLILTNGTEALQYGSGQGHPKLREQICEVMALEGIRAHPEDVVVTTGSQQALDLISRIFIDPGDVVLVEAPSYVGALGTFHQYQASVVHVAMDNDGMIPDALRDAIKTTRAAGRKIKFLYLIPNYQNPTGVLLPAAKKRSLLLKIILTACLVLIVQVQTPCALKIVKTSFTWDLSQKQSHLVCVWVGHLFRHHLKTN